MAPGEFLHVITRVRRIDDVPIIFERIFVPIALMPDLAVQVGRKLDDEMYVIYQEQFGISIARASERLAGRRNVGGSAPPGPRGRRASA